jgi:hypothetical protein
MATLVVDTLRLARGLEAAGFTSGQAQGAAGAIAEAITEWPHLGVDRPRGGPGGLPDPHDHDWTTRTGPFRLPEGVLPAHDGLVVELEG